jgi:NADH-quinone oxidoreductase subunit N
MQNEFLYLMQQELAVTVLILVLLLMKLSGRFPAERFLQLSLLVTISASLRVFFSGQEGILFAGMFQSGKLLVLEKSILLTALTVLLLVHYDELKRHSQLPELLVLLFSSLLGMLLMVSSGNLLILYISLELATIPAAALVNFDLGGRRSAEGAMKMILSSAFASGIFLFGISLLYGSFGTIQFSEMGILWKGDVLQSIGFVMLLCGFAFKLSAVPFHLWTADVYEGAPVPVTAFLSVVSKAAAAFIFITVLYRIFLSSIGWIRIILIVLALLTLLVGNLFALRQNQLKRFIAFSSITQVGFILVAITSGSSTGVAAVVYFLLIYLFSNLAFFGVVSAVSRATGRETIDELRGLYQENKFLGWVLVIALFSLAGVPPTAGFFGKLFLIMAGAIKGSVGFIMIVALNIVISLYYYLRVVRAVFSESDGRPFGPIPISLPVRIGMIICVAGIVVTGLWGHIYEYIRSLT